MRIAIEVSNSPGVMYHRQLIQHRGMDYELINPGDKIPDGTDIFVTTDRAPFRENIPCKVVVDIDDYPVPPPHHILAGSAKLYDQKSKTIRWCDRADLITTTTVELSANIHRLAWRIAYVLPNAIDKTEPQFALEPVKLDGIKRIGFVGGSTHGHDLKLIRHAVKQLYADPDYNERFCFVYAGYDDDVKATDLRGNKIKGFVSPHVEAELMFSNGELTLGFMSDKDQQSVSKRYYRRYAQNIHNYASVYTVLDAAIAPLEDHRFNQCKSELKFVEAAAFGVPLICSDVGAYSHLNSVIKCRNSAEWLQAFKDVIDGVNLPNPTEEANEKFNIERIREQRALLYKSLLNG